MKQDIHHLDCYNDFPPFLWNQKNKKEGNQDRHVHGMMVPFVSKRHLKISVESTNNCLLTTVFDVYGNFIQRFRNHYDGQTFLMPCDAKWERFENDSQSPLWEWKKIDYLNYFLQVFNLWHFYHHLESLHQHRPSKAPEKTCYNKGCSLLNKS